MSPKCLGYLVTTTLAAALGTADAAAASEVAPLVPSITPSMPGPVIVRFHDALGEGLKAGGLQVVEPSVVRARLRLPPENAGCAEGPCLNVARVSLGASVRLATAKIATVGKNYEITVQLFSGQSSLAASTGRCDICTLAEALNATRRIATEASSRAEEPPDPLPPAAAEPPPAEVIAPQESGATTAVDPADDKPGLPDESAPVEPASRPAATVDTPRRWPLWPALATLGLGAVGLGVGIPLLAMDGDPTNCIGPPRPDTQNCADLYDTAGGGWLMTGVGIVAMTASGVLFYLHLARGRDSQEQATTQVSLVPVDGGAVFGAYGVF